MSREDALALVRRLLIAARARDLVTLGDCYAEDAVAESPAFGVVRGRENIVGTWATLFSSFADVVVDISTLLVDGDRVAVLSALTTSSLPRWFGQPSLGAPITYRLVLLFTLADGRVVLDQRIYDSAGVLERLEKMRMDKELRTAADVQRALLARQAFFGGFHESAGESIPCRAIGGDFFDFIELASGDVGLVIGDVAGKGTPAALLAALLQGMLEADDDGHSPAAALSRINKRLNARDFGARFATLVLAVLSPSGRLVYANAGHNPPALLSGRGITRLTSGGPILGAFRDMRFEEGTLQLTAGDALVMFTDGVTEARNRADEEFGEERLLQCLGDPRHDPPRLLSRIFDAVRGFCDEAEQNDDITATVTQFR